MNYETQDDSAKTSNMKKLKSIVNEKYFQYSCMQLVLAGLIALLGVWLPDYLFSQYFVTKGTIPGNIINVTFTDINNSTNRLITKELIKDSRFDYSHINSSNEIISVATLVYLDTVIPLLLVLIIEIILYIYYEWKYWYRNYALFVLSYSLSMSFVFWSTKTIKYIVKWPRPDFYDRCIPYINNSTYALECTNIFGKNSIMDEAWESFPSGHASYIFAAMTCLGYFILSKFNYKPLVNSIIICNNSDNYYDHTNLLLIFYKIIFGYWPWYLSIYVGFSRIINNYHSSCDVLCGFIVGYISGLIGYLSIYQINNPYSLYLFDWNNINHNYNNYINFNKQNNNNRLSLNKEMLEPISVMEKQQSCETDTNEMTNLNKYG